MTHFLAVLQVIALCVIAVCVLLSTLRGVKL